jgi:hypothetical protein
MKKAPEHKNDRKMRAEYDFSQGARGKYARRYVQGTNVVLLDRDVAKAFPDAAVVNDSLRALARIIRQQQKTVSQS